MKNYWLDEIDINNSAILISNSLYLKFKGTKPNEDEWGRWTLDLIRVCPQRVRDALMWKYTFKYQIDEQEHVQFLEFVKLPWLI